MKSYGKLELPSNTTLADLGILDDVPIGMPTVVALSNVQGTGLFAITSFVADPASASATVRSIVGTGDSISVTNGNGVSGNPTIDIGSNVATLSGTQTFSGSKTFSSQITSSVATGTAPFSIASRTVVTNLNADFLDGNDSSYYASASSVSTHISDQTLHLTSGQNTWLDAITVTSAEVNYLSGVSSNLQTQLGNKEPTISSGTTGQYYRGDKSWQTLDKTAVGLGSVENTALSTWAGTANITTLGTISTGTWSGTAVGTTKGGTGQTLYTVGDILYASANDSLSKLSGNTTTTRKFLRQTGNGSVSAAPAWDTVTASDVGLGSVENTALSTWAGTSNITTVGTISTGTWNATAIGITKGGTGQTSASAAFNALSPTTTLGDIIYADGASSDTRLAGNITTTKKFLRQTGNGSVSAAPAWDTVTASDVGLGNVENTALSTWTGSTNITTAGNLTASSLTVTGTLTVNGATETINSTVTTIVDPILDIGGGTGGAAPISNDGKDRGLAFQWHNGTSAKRGFFGYDNSTGYFTFIPDATVTSEVVSGTKGTLDATILAANVSGALASSNMPAFTGDATSSSGASALTLATVNSNTGSFGTASKVATFTVNGKGLITAASETSIALAGSAITSGNVAATVGGTGQTTYTVGDILYSGVADTLSKLAGNTTTTKKFLRQTGSGSASAAPAWDAVTATDVGLGSVENTALSTWAGSSNIVTLGTISTGTWNATAIGITKGGTGQTTASAAFNALSPITTLGDLVYGNGANSATRLAGNTTGTKQFLSQTGNGSVSAAPSWSAVSKSDVGLGSVENTALSTWAGTANITTVGTISSGTWSGTAIAITKGGTGQITASASFNALSPTTTLGDIIYADGASSNTRLAGNTTGTKQFLSQTGTGAVSAAPSWSAISKSDVGLGSVENTALSTWAGSSNIVTLGTISTGTWSGTAIAETKGGTGQTSYALGDTLYSSATNTLSKLSGNTTTTRKFLRQTGNGSVSAAPAWDTVTASDVGLGSVENTALSTWAGTSNITTVGTIGTGTWNATAIAITKGGTGQTSASAAFNALSPTTALGDLIYADSASSDTRLAGNITTTRKFLRQTGNGSVSAAPAWDTLTTSDVGLGNVENTALSTWAGTANITTLGTIGTGTWNATAIGITKGGTGQTSASAAFNALSPITTLGDVIYGSAANTSSRLAGNTTSTKQFLSQTGTGTVSAAPSWSAVSKSDVGLGSVENTALSTWAGTANITTLGTISTGTWNATAISVAKGGTGLSALGTANQVLGMNSGATALEYKTLTQGSGITITHAAGSVTIASTGTIGNDLTAIEALSSTGVPVRTATDTWAQKSLGINPDDIVQAWSLSKSAFIDGPVGWVDLECGATQMRTNGSTAPTYKASVGTQMDYAFVGTGTTVNEGWMRFHLPHDLVINANSKLYFHVHWFHTTASPTGNVYWQIDWVYGKGYSQAEMTAATTIGITGTPAAYTTRPKHQIDECAEANAILSTSLEEDGIIMIRVMRDPANANDTFANDAFLLGIDLHYLSMAGGSTKEKIYPFTKWYE